MTPEELKATRSRLADANAVESRLEAMKILREFFSSESLPNRVTFRRASDGIELALHAQTNDIGNVSLRVLALLKEAATVGLDEMIAHTQKQFDKI